MATATLPDKKAPTDQRKLIEMSWDPITRIVGSLGIYTKIDFANRQVAECHSTSSIFRGYSIFMKGKDPRDAHFITSRICGICGDNHATCATYAQNMAFGVRPPALAEWIVNLGEAAEYMFDHNIFQDNLVGVDFCEQMVKETNPTVWDKAATDAGSPCGRPRLPDHRGHHARLNPFDGRVLSRDPSRQPLHARDVLPDGRAARSPLHALSRRRRHGSHRPALHRLPVRLARYAEFMKKVVPLHDDLFDFFYEALPGYEEVGRRRILLGCWGSFNDPEVCDYTYARHERLGTPDVRHARGGGRRQGRHQRPGGHQPQDPHPAGSSYYEDWEQGETFVTHDPLGNPVDQHHPWNQTTIPRPQKRDFDGKYTWVMSPRWYDQRTRRPPGS